MKEKIREILTVKRGVVYGDFPGLIADLEHLINQEVEKRIAERMPSEEEIEARADELYEAGMAIEDESPKNSSHKRVCLHEAQGYRSGAWWIRNRLTNPGVKDSQKTEGGGDDKA